MVNICYNCGEYRADKGIDSTKQVAICPLCGFEHPIKFLPLMVVTGACGAGKSTVCQTILGKLNEVVILEGDLLWRDEFKKPESNYQDFYETWLRLSKSISQSGRPVVMFNAGGVPQNIEPLVERRYFSQVCYLALVCNDTLLEKRLSKRPAWRGSGTDAYIDEHVRFNQWFKNRNQSSQPVIDIIDTTQDSISVSSEKVVTWIRGKLRECGL